VAGLCSCPWLGTTAWDKRTSLVGFGVLASSMQEMEREKRVNEIEGKKKRENVMNFYLFFILLVSKQCSANLWRTVHTLKKFQQNEEADGGCFVFFSSLLHQKVILVRLL
jgi:hypothetical protein